MFFGIKSAEALGALCEPQDRAGLFAVVSRRRGGSRRGFSFLARHETRAREATPIRPQPSAAGPTD